MCIAKKSNPKLSLSLSKCEIETHRLLYKGVFRHLYTWQYSPLVHNQILIKCFHWLWIFDYSMENIFVLTLGCHVWNYVLPNIMLNIGYSNLLHCSLKCAHCDDILYIIIINSPCLTKSINNVAVVLVNNKIMLYKE